MGEITLILGGTRSGKSQYAIKLAKATNKQVLFIATACTLDKEMQLRIRLHKKNRPSDWKTIEEPKNLVSILKNLPTKPKLIIIDCLTLYISNLLMDNCTDAYIEDKVGSILKVIKKSDFDSVLISNEVGLGIVPDNPLARRFRDLSGRINQRVANVSDRVYFMISGLAMDVK